jgi:hypothetical protein
MTPGSILKVYLNYQIYITMPGPELTLIFPDNALHYREKVKNCLLPLLCLWTADGPIPMRFMGGTKNISGGRCYIKYPIPPTPSP